MAERKPFLLRLDREVHAALERWAADELRSVNGQIEYVLREAVRKRKGTATSGPPPIADDRPPEKGRT